MLRVEAIQECVSMLVLHPDVHFLQFLDQLLGRIDCICEKKIKITSVVSLSLVDLLSLEVSGGTFLQKVCDLNTFFPQRLPEAILTFNLILER